MKIFKNRLTWLITILLLTILRSPITQGKNETFPVDMIKPGMTGYGLTVFSGTKIDKFNVKVIEVTKGNNNEKMILVKLSGKKLVKNGGLASGMSGSPVYINKKLVGAISYGFPNADPLLALITPIDIMLDIFKQSSDQITTMQENLEKINFTTKVNQKLVPTPITTPITISGMSQRSYELLHQSFKSVGLETFSLAGSSSTDLKRNGYGKIKPGSAIAVKMVTGDYQVLATGTVTWVNNNYFLAFGHPFLNRGQVDFVASEAQVLHVVNSKVMSYKIGAPIKPIGRVSQDRPAGILGVMGELPNLINVQVDVRDRDRNLDYASNFQVVNLEDLYRKFIVAGTINAIDKTIERKGAGTAKVSFRVETDNEHVEIIRENLFYGQDIAHTCVKDLDRLLEIITTNEFNEIRIKNIIVEIEIESLQKSARIIKVDVVEKNKVKPGETVNINVTARTYRGFDFVTPFKIKIPNDLMPGKILLTFHGSGQVEEKNSEEKKQVAQKNINSFKDLINDYLNTPKNNEIVLEYQPDTEEKEESDLLPIVVKIPTKYHIVGEVHIVLEVIDTK